MKTSERERKKDFVGETKGKINPAASRRQGRNEEKQRGRKGK